MCGALSEGDSVDIAADDYAKFNSLHPLISYFPGMHAEYTAGDTLGRELSELVHELRAPFWAHISETESETLAGVERRGMTPTEYFDSLGLFDYGGGGYHCVWLSDHDMEIFARRGLTAVTCPASNAKLASGIAPLCELSRRGIKLAVGTDGPASNNALDMFRELYLACVLQKLRERGRRGLPGRGRALRRLLRRRAGHGPRRLRLPGPPASRRISRSSIWTDPTCAPSTPRPKNLVYSGSKENVRLTMVAGHILYENGAFLSGDAERIYAEGREAHEGADRGWNLKSASPSGLTPTGTS